ncbi:MAG: HAD family hydrolase [Candidatus Alkanophagales archaeon]|nr:MAG: HAD family hydrolase [Candidatus Alkanophagales archaeon]
MHERLRGVRVVSFDVDGTLTDKKFVDAVWLRGIPEIYAETHDTSFEDALKMVMSAYEEVGENSIEWYLIDYWLRRFQLDVSYEKIFERFKHEIRVYPEVEGVLQELSAAGYELIVCSNAAREFINVQIADVKHYFSRIFSAVSDFRQVKKSNGFYLRVCEILKVKPQEVVHVGDHWVFDFLNPRKVGINAFFLDRRDERCGTFVIKSLEELLDILRPG